MKKLNGRTIDDSGVVIFDEAGLEDMISKNKMSSSLVVEKTYEIELLNEQLKKFRNFELNYYSGPQNNNTSNWNTPEPFKSMDIEEYIFSLSKTEEEDARIALELSMFYERDLYPLLRHMIYLVDHFRKNNIVWGVGRGSSVSSYVLFLVGLHRINSLHYNLSIDEFLK